MKESNYCQVATTVRVVTLRVMSPFHQLLLAGLQAFPAGQRPDLAALTERLCIGEPVFLEDAWKDLVTWRAVDHDSFAAAGLTVAGEAARKTGVWRMESPTERTYEIIFDQSTGEPINPRGDEWEPGSLLANVPAWAVRLSLAEVEAAVRAQPDGEYLRPNQALESFSFSWKLAREIHRGLRKNRKE